MSSLQHREKGGSIAVFYFTSSSSSFLLCRSYYLSVSMNCKRRGEKKDAMEMRRATLYVKFSF